MKELESWRTEGFLDSDDLSATREGGVSRKKNRRNKNRKQEESMDYMTEEQCSLLKSVASDTFAKASAYYVGPSVILQSGDEAVAPASWAGPIPQKDFAVETALSSKDGLKTLPGIAAKDPDLMLCLRNTSLFPVELLAGDILATSQVIPEGTTLQRRAEHPVSVNREKQYAVFRAS